VLPLYIHAPEEEGDWMPGGASQWWLHHSLATLQAQLGQRGVSLHIRQGDSLAVLQQLLAQTAATTVYWNRLYEPAAIARDRGIKAALREHGVQAHSFNAALWCEPWQVETKQQGPYRVFTPFWRTLRTGLGIPQTLPVPATLRGIEAVGGMPLEALRLLPRIPWDCGLREAWRPGEQGAQELLDIFADDAIADYAQARDLPSRHGTSRLSPHLHFGEISPRQIHRQLADRIAATDTRRRPDIEPYLRELGWRAFAHHRLYHFPTRPRRTSIRASMVSTGQRRAMHGLSAGSAAAPAFPW
jgi:deoxyribodipyrimidine photo-lyase